MFSLSDLMIIFLLVGIMIFWWNSMLARQNARAAASNVCQNYKLQLIDDTVERIKIGFVRDANGHLVFQRTYHFEFTTDGSRRYGGAIVMRGRHVIDVKLDPYIEAMDNVVQLHRDGSTTVH